MVLDKVASYYPQAKFIILHRDPRDNILVKIKRAKIKGHGASLFYFAKFWNYTYNSLNNKLKKIESNRYLHVKYEDLVSSPEQTLQNICRFLSINYHADMLNFSQKFNQEIKSDNSKLNKSLKEHIGILHQSLSEKVNTNKVGLWKKELNAHDNNLIWSICGKTALINGYSEEGCQHISYFKMSYLYDWLQFIYKRIIVPKVYNLLPFQLKYFLKKVKYRKQIKQEKLIVTKQTESKI